VSRIAALLALALVACATAGKPTRDDYVRYSTFASPFNDHVLLRWQTRKMPLRVYLPAPPADATEDPEAVLDAVRDGFTDWIDAAAPGVPSFVFVGDPGAADIPVAWETEPSGDWYIAHCALDIDVGAKQFGVSRILVMTRVPGTTWSLDDLYLTMLHEVGHALGLGHSPETGDVMYRSARSGAAELSARDRATLRKLYTLPIGHRVAGARSAD
jgi:hypothetical protein